MTKLLFIGDVVGDPGLDYLETHLPRLVHETGASFVIANGENSAVTGPAPAGGCGMSVRAVERMLASGVQLITGGNHSWDGSEAEKTLAIEQVLRPLNHSPRGPGRGAATLAVNGTTLGVVNLASRTAIPHVDAPLDVLERQLESWQGRVDHVLVDFHGESVSEKQIFAWAVAGRVSAVLGTHTHAATLDARILPGGTAFVSDVGMTGPSGGMQGYQPDTFIEAIRLRRPARGPTQVACGPVELGAVLVELGTGGATGIQRL
ncbi:MAG: YmdB family metallophosphoesterase [Trueperaceae bacterium]|nr:MAG: YmdB family metallophosphoesterase [Trueperaceae bacterium]